MAHYLAEKLDALKSAKGARKQELEKECSDIILKIWSHRASLPYKNRPFQNFDAVFRALESLDPAKERNRYFNLDIPGHTPLKKLPDEVKYWLDLAIGVDRGARALIRTYLDMAVAKAAEEEAGWIKAVRALVPNEDADLRVIFNFVSPDDPPEKEPDPAEVERQWLIGLRDNLVEMVRGAAKVLPGLEKQVSELEKKGKTDG
jgi:hypothetical protein